jgi:Flp pilus assembly protein TadB
MQQALAFGLVLLFIYAGAALVYWSMSRTHRRRDPSWPTFHSALVGIGKTLKAGRHVPAQRRRIR